MDAPVEIVRGDNRSPAQPDRNWSRRALWVTGLLAVAVIAALAFGAYRQPELLLNMLGLRYCG